MTESQYDRTITAALSETQSKFAIAEALALDIPAEKRGPTPPDELGVKQRLEAARVAILDAGGEPRTVETLYNYRRTALWVFDFKVKNFLWVTGASFTAHKEAMLTGLSYDAFCALPDKKANTVRAALGNQDKYPPAPKNWTPEQQVQAARQVLADPEVAREAFADQKTEKTATEALTSTPEAADRIYQAAREAKIKHARSERGQPEPPHTKAADAKRERIIRFEQVADELIAKLADVLDPDLDPTGQRLRFVADNIDALSDSYRQRLARAVKELAARASDWEDRMLGISGHTVTAPSSRQEGGVS